MGNLLNEDELSGVDPRLVDIVRTAAQALPYDVRITDGMRSGGKGNHKRGYAIDVQLIEPTTGAALPNKMYYSGTRKVIPGAIEAFPIYEQFAQTARGVQTATYPELTKVFRWGGGFRQGGTPFDMMHLDITPKAAGAMAYYDWETGITAAAKANRPELAGRSFLPPANIPGVASALSVAPTPAPRIDRAMRGLAIVDITKGGKVNGAEIPANPFVGWKRGDPVAPWTREAASLQPGVANGQIGGIVFHHTGTQNFRVSITAGQNDDGQKRTGAQYYIDRDGTVYRYASDTDVMQNVSTSKYRTDSPGTRWLNNQSVIGIEVVAANSSDFTAAQKKAAAALGATLAGKYGILPENIIGHGAIQGGLGGNKEADEGMILADLARAAIPPRPVARIARFGEQKAVSANAALIDMRAEARVQRAQQMVAQARAVEVVRQRADMSGIPGSPYVDIGRLGGEPISVVDPASIGLGVDGNAGGLGALTGDRPFPMADAAAVARGSFPARPEGPAAGMPVARAPTAAATPPEGPQGRGGKRGVTVPVPAPRIERTAERLAPLTIGFEPMSDRSGASVAESLGRPVVTPSGRIYGDPSLSGGIAVGTVRSGTDGYEFEWNRTDSGKWGWVAPRGPIKESELRAPRIVITSDEAAPQPMPRIVRGTVAPGFGLTPEQKIAMDVYEQRAEMAASGSGRAIAGVMAGRSRTLIKATPTMRIAAAVGKASVGAVASAAVTVKGLGGVVYPAAPRPAPAPSKGQLTFRAPPAMQQAMPEPSSTKAGVLSDEFVRPALAKVSPPPISRPRVAPVPMPRILRPASVAPVLPTMAGTGSAKSPTAQQPKPAKVTLQTTAPQKPAITATVTARGGISPPQTVSKSVKIKVGTSKKTVTAPAGMQFSTTGTLVPISAQAAFSGWNTRVVPTTRIVEEPVYEDRIVTVANPAYRTGPRVPRAPAPPPTVKGSATGRAYVIGQTYEAGGYTYQAQANGTFAKVAKVDTTAQGKAAGAAILRSVEHEQSAGVTGIDMDTAPKSIRESTRWQTGY